ncbi:CGP-CTERM-anchored Cys-rich protein [Pyrococcus yayanosii]|uniref:Eight-cysteine-cluster domain-containing protein n=1 Tax=Pyrococcus yayanosii (strain CH1 / JCM 16557) TaxID=529709 RepID=F8AIW1_PYRYC|nr:CGP-CTERM-anchored Cys-rich protein [Pyrococcus yayanosii]AEH24436.1 hypothetical protein PYCH_07490 [Pyrococcus yayanosii CH1]
MRRPYILIFFLLLSILRPVSACISPADPYAVEVELNKPGITFDLTPLLRAENILLDNGRIVYRSHYDPRLIVILWNDTYLHLRIQIPLELRNTTDLKAEVEIIAPLDDSVREKAKSLGWAVDGWRFTKGRYLVELSPIQGGECRSDADCATGGCSGEICTTRKGAKEIVSICVYREWYDCLKLTTCGCYNGYCMWKPTPEFLSCLQEKGLDPKKIVKARYNAIVLIMDREEPTDEDYREIETLLSVIGCHAELRFEPVKREGLRPIADPYSLNASEALRIELEWLRDIGVLNVSEDDIAKISKVAEFGRAGYNSRIGWFDGEWKPYFESENAVLVKCISSEAWTYDAPENPPVLPSSATPTETIVCGPGIMLLLVILAAGVGKK